MRKEIFSLSEDQRVQFTVYLHEPSPELPLWGSRPAVLVLPGGGYRFTSDREADPVALAFLAQGFHAAVLRYSVDQYAAYPAPLVDVSRALKLMRERAADWGLNPQQIALCGFSAGGHLAASLGTLWNDPEVQAAAGVSGDENQPQALLLCYPVISLQKQGLPAAFAPDLDEQSQALLAEKLSCERHVGPQTPPSFLFHTYGDNLVPVEHSYLFAQALTEADIPHELHVFEHGVHGLALANELTSSGAAFQVDASAAQWFGLASTWLWRCFGKPQASIQTDIPTRRAHLGVPIETSEGESIATSGRFSLDTVIGDILDHAGARAVLARFLPELASQGVPDAARSIALRGILAYVGDVFPDPAREALGQELEAIVVAEERAE